MASSSRERDRRGRALPEQFELGGNTSPRRFKAASLFGYNERWPARVRAPQPPAFPHSSALSIRAKLGSDVRRFGRINTRPFQWRRADAGKSTRPCVAILFVSLAAWSGDALARQDASASRGIESRADGNEHSP